MWLKDRMELKLPVITLHWREVHYNGLEMIRGGKNQRTHKENLVLVESLKRFQKTTASKPKCCQLKHVRVCQYILN
jgi:hypothetical protein